MFERFSPRTRHVMVEAQRQAIMLDHSFIGTEHLLLGILAEQGPTAELLASLGVTLEAARIVVDTIGEVRPGTEARPFSPRAKGALDQALRHALRLGDELIEPHHILFGVVADPEGRAVAVLERLGRSPNEVRAAVSARWPTVPEAAFGERFSYRGLGPRECVFCRRNLAQAGRHVAVGPVGLCEECINAARAALDGAAPGASQVELAFRVIGPLPDARAVELVKAAVTAVFGGTGPRPEAQAESLEDAASLERYLREVNERVPGALQRTWVPRVHRIEFTGPDTAEVLFTVESRGTTAGFEGRVRRIGDRWMVTRDTMVAILARAGVTVPPGTAEG
jgi:hypothetical protein